MPHPSGRGVTGFTLILGSEVPACPAPPGLGRTGAWVWKYWSNNDLSKKIKEALVVYNFLHNLSPNFGKFFMIISSASFFQFL